MAEQEKQIPHEEPVSYVNPNMPSGSGNNIWQAFKSSKILKIGLPILLVALLPVIVLLAREQQTNQSRASKATVLSFTPNSSPSAPITVTEGDDVNVQVLMDPGSNLVSMIDLSIEYDSQYFILENPNDFQPNKVVFPDPIQTTYATGRIQAVLTIGADPTKAISAQREIATLRLKAIKSTEAGTTTLIRFGAQTRVLSMAATDQFSENVLSNTTPAVVAIEKNVNIGNIKGQYVDKDNKLLTLAGTRAVLYADGSQDGTVVTTAPEFVFNNIKTGKYRLQLLPKSGYSVLTALCKPDCVTAVPEYAPSNIINFDVAPGATTNISVKYSQTASITPVVNPSTTIQSTTVVCSPTTADLNKDGRVDNADSTKFANCYKKSPTVAGCEASDIDKNGAIDAVDANCILRGGQ